jgi:hypothetical protein
MEFINYLSKHATPADDDVDRSHFDNHREVLSVVWHTFCYSKWVSCCSSIVYGKPNLRVYCTVYYLFDNDMKKANETTTTTTEENPRTREVSKRGPRLNTVYFMLLC